MAGRKTVSTKDMGGLKITQLGTATNADEAVNKGQMDTQSTADRSRANHTGTQTASTVSDFDTQVRTSRLDQMTAPTGAVSFNSQKITNLLDGTNPQDAVSKSQLDAAIAALSGGLAFKGAVKVAVGTNVNLAAPGSTLDGVTMSNGDHFLATAQTTGSQGGEYVYNGSAVAATRATTADTSAEMPPGSMWVVAQGTKDNQLAILSNNTFVLGTDTPTFVYLNPGAAADNDTGYTTTSPAVSAGATWTVTHNLGTKAVLYAVYRTASPFDEVDIYGTRDSTTVLSLVPDVAMSSGEYTVVVSAVV